MFDLFAEAVEDLYTNIIDAYVRKTPALWEEFVMKKEDGKWYLVDPNPSVGEPTEATAENLCLDIHNNLKFSPRLCLWAIERKLKETEEKPPPGSFAEFVLNQLRKYIEGRSAIDDDYYKHLVINTQSRTFEDANYVNSIGSKVVIRPLSETLEFSAKKDLQLQRTVMWKDLPHSNFTLQARIRQLDAFWTWLSRSPSPLPQKLTCLTVVAWPRGLHGIAGVILGKEHFQKLRTRALQSLGVHRKGTNPKLVVSAIVHPRHDPEFHSLVLTVKSFRKFCAPDQAFPLLDWLSTQPIDHLWPGPCGVFLTRLHSVGWSWVNQGCLQDHEGLQLHILESPIQVLMSRLHDAWLCAVGCEVAQRPDFVGLHTIDRIQTTRDMHTWDQESLGLLRVVMTGAFFTRDWLCKMGKVPTSSCPWCGEEDSIFHRHWVCDHFQFSRNVMQPSTFRSLDTLPECTQLHGWITEAPEARVFRQLLHGLPDLTGDFLIAPPLANELHMFTDGSCLRPERANLRVATWGLVVANLFDDHFTPIGQGPLPGLHQTVVRAEFTATISALKFALVQQLPAWLWTDNQQALEHVQFCLADGFAVSIMDRDHDLKNQVFQLVQELRRKHIPLCVVKVTSHVSHTLAFDSVEEWALRGNQAADACAEKAREGFSTQFFAVWHGLCATVLEQDQLRQDLHSHIVRVGSTAVADKRRIQNLNEQQWETYSPAIDVTPAMLVDLPRVWPHPPMPKHGAFEAAVWQWFAELVSPSEGEVHCVCWYQFLIDFQLTTG